MEIRSYVDSTAAQEKAIKCFERVEVRTALIKPSVVVTIRTFQRQAIKVTLDANGIIQHVGLFEI